MSEAAGLHLALERISSLFRAELRTSAAAHDLKLVQLEALVYFANANRYSDTASALTEYLGLTKGTTSQTIQALERRGLLEKHADDQDGRILHCRLTRAGAAIVDEAFPVEWGSASREELRAAEASAIQLLARLQAARGHRSFGQCSTCRMFQRNGARFTCGLTGEPLTKRDSLQICREHAA